MEKNKAEGAERTLLPTEIWGRGTVAATIAALSGEPTVHPPRVMQETRVITGTPGGREGCSQRSSLSTGKRHGGIFEVLGCSGSLGSVHMSQAHLA